METPNTKIKVLEIQMTEFKQENDRQHSDIKQMVIAIDGKIDKFFECMNQKADKTELIDTNNKIWGLVIGVLLSLLAAIISLIKKG